MPEGRLQGRIALITGGSRGIGLAVAHAFAREGASLALAARDVAKLEAAAASLREAGAQAEPFACDVTDPAQAEALADQVQSQLGAVEILVNNAGAGGSHKFLGHPDELWHKMIQVNLTGCYLVSKSVVPGMIERRWGRIINMASVASKVGLRYMVAYTASKHGLLGLTRALAVELNPYHITVNAICPGYVDTPMTEAAIANIVERTGMAEEEARSVLMQTNPQNRLIHPDEVAAVAVMLAADEARGITGQAINVDGGAVMF